MIKTLIRRLFFPERKRNEITNDLKSNPHFSIKDEIQKHGTNAEGVSDFILEKGKVQSVFTPELGNQKNLILKKWHSKTGDIIKIGDVVCIIENENITMEFESVFSGRILSTCKVNEKLTIATELFQIEGI
ncbi:biotin/lipoyl-containing protein [Zobellia laminariae]|uniref:biotin/lipoyl-containing protein n=1 Tax=Zobellia laminariae TaxID=248906 RepID=UPI0012D94385|nr:hypothetical protein [Zobellia laminariae]